MNKKDIMREFIKMVDDEGLMTLFIKNIFDYDNFNDYNYLFRMKEGKKQIIIDIYDNISDNRFNRYIFSFTKGDFNIKVIEECNVFVSYINVLSVEDCDDKLLKLAYLFKIRRQKMIDYASSFLDEIIVEKLRMVLNKPIQK